MFCTRLLVVHFGWLEVSVEALLVVSAKTHIHGTTHILKYYHSQRMAINDNERLTVLHPLSTFNFIISTLYLFAVFYIYPGHDGVFCS